MHVDVMQPYPVLCNQLQGKWWLTRVQTPGYICKKPPGFTG